MKSILVLASTYPRWNNDTEPLFVHYLCKQLAREYRVIALVPHYPGASRHEEMDGIQVHRFRYFFSFGEHLAYDGGIIQNLKKNRLKLLLVPLFMASQFINILLLCRRHKISLIHAHWVIPQGLLAITARKWRLIPKQTRIVCTSHGGDLFSLQGGILQSLKRFVFRNADHVTVVSTAMRDYLLGIGCNTANVSVQSMGVDLHNRFIPDSGTIKTHELVFVGRLVEKKGVVTLIEALPRLIEKHSDLTLAIVGDGPEKPVLEQKVRDLGIEQHVKFPGPVPNEQVPGYYQSARIAVVPSVIAADGDQEGLGLVAVEALGCGCATLVSDLPALRDVVEDGVNGLVFRSGDAADLASKIAQILDNRELYNRLVQNGQQSVKEKFDWQRVGNRYRDIMSKCLPEDGPN